uniref:hypothetical protein n=1 Tax=Ningiella ruwaisensis TaxID=2364274 RepID=UPI00109FDBC9|nr:hypothetical protein [Ningiella ruwaisensis]
MKSLLIVILLAVVLVIKLYLSQAEILVFIEPSLHGETEWKISACDESLLLEDNFIHLDVECEGGISVVSEIYQTEVFYVDSGSSIFISVYRENNYIQTFMQYY